jgi:hypothetical protein
VATLIITGVNIQEAWLKREVIIKAIKDEWGIKTYIDQCPVNEYIDEVNFVRIASRK